MLSETGKVPQIRALFQELHRLGYIEGQNLIVQRYSGEGRTEYYAELARDVVLRKPDLIFAQSNRLVRHFKAATTTIPLVGIVADPISTGLAASLGRHGANITGVVSDAGIQFWDKHLQFLMEATPTASRVGYLTPRAVWDDPPGAAIRAAARRIGITLLGALLDGPIEEAEYRRAFAFMAQERTDALIVNDAPEHYSWQQLIVELAENARLPTVYTNRAFVEGGGLMAYGTDKVDLFRHAADQIDQILKGAKPSDIPFYQATKFDLVINLKTAKTLGLTIPTSLLVQAAEVIE
jgi:putative ABC transport system substrate-binding protein